MNEKVKTTFWLIAYTFTAGLLITLFTVIEDFYRYLFSLLALYIGIRFFRRFETLGYRITFFVLSIVFFLIFAVFYSMFIYIKDNPDALTGA
ncbi:hypothetical protein FHS16_002257 [Paenibacillus endophyticus]|uniref:Uncharacterized protein n=1 Tax=Paenibacillus endophyticus TaxID=1294268 RepID=A0A7W5C6Y6_9BACL|nr:hypothetical protein [Paenibacillus endophyticus]MBB3152211.1 hypothetical protein [Paenibacillus endophyticus]